METINTLSTLLGVVIGAAFLLAGGVLLPLWEVTESRRERKVTRDD
ncbi:hypothetical protein [Stackebrandtia albiflava]|nr:hypothetical protein [Stackebrandtia albiflava]